MILQIRHGNPTENESRTLCGNIGQYHGWMRRRPQCCHNRIGHIHRTIVQRRVTTTGRTGVGRFVLGNGGKQGHGGTELIITMFGIGTWFDNDFG